MTKNVPAPPPAQGATGSARMAWIVLAVLLLFSIAAPINQFKVPPLLPVLMQALNLSVTRAGLLMSVFAVTGLILAIPAGFIFQKMGARLTGLLAGGSIVIGAALGAVSSGVDSLLLSRVIEGIGTSFMAVLAPAIIAVWFAAKKRGVAMGVWANWVPIGSTAMLILAPILARQGAWRAVWWFGALYALAVSGLYLLVVKSPRHPVAPTALPASSPSATAAEMRGVLRNRHLWLLGAAFGFFTMAFMGFATYLPTYLSLVQNIPLAQAAQWASLVTIAAIISAPLAGILSDRIGSRKIPYELGLVLNAILLPLGAIFHGNPLIVLILVQGLAVGIVPPNIFAAATEVVGDERLGGLAMGVIMVGQNAGMLTGPIIFGALIESAWGWPLAFGSLAAMCLLGALAGGLAKVKAIPE